MWLSFLGSCTLISDAEVANKVGVGGGDTSVENGPQDADFELTMVKRH